MIAEDFGARIPRMWGGRISHAGTRRRGGNAKTKCSDHGRLKSRAALGSKGVLPLSSSAPPRPRVRSAFCFRRNRVTTLRTNAAGVAGEVVPAASARSRRLSGSACEPRQPDSRQHARQPGDHPKIVNPRILNHSKMKTPGSRDARAERVVPPAKHALRWRGRGYPESLPIREALSLIHNDLGLTNDHF